MNTREQLKLYIKEEGVTQTHIARKLGISKSMMNMYLKGTRNLSQEREQDLQNFLASKITNCG